MYTDNKDFYPTPPDLIKKMFDCVNFETVYDILEPSAGKGDIVDKLREKSDSKRYSHYCSVDYDFDIDCIEIEENLRHILKGKGYRVVYDDFLKYNTRKEYDLIIMNPPFSEGCKHLLKALEMQQRGGGQIVCLLNAETIKNPFSNERKDLIRKLEEYHAKIEYIENAFLLAERRTDIEIAMIYVKLPAAKSDSFIISNLRKAQERMEVEETQYTHLAENDFFKSIIDQYNFEVEAGIRLIREYYAMTPNILACFDKDKETGETVQTGGCILSLDMSDNRDKYSNKLSVNNFIKAVRRKYWTALFKNPAFMENLTGNLRTEYHNKIDELENYEFSIFNIYEIKIDMMSRITKGVEETILALFDEFSHKHYWYDEMGKNIHYYNGWKTNKAHIINKKVIIPLSGFDTFWGNKYPAEFKPTDYKVKEKLKDIEKCFNYLDGSHTASVDMDAVLAAAKEEEKTKNIDLKYFTITFYKKGTCHITFKNDELLKKFNIFGSQHKGWLPPTYGKKSYHDMTQEEKTVIDEFEGEESYQETMRNTDYFLFDSSKIAMLEAAN